VAWKIAERMPATPSPVLVDDLLYVVNDTASPVALSRTGKSIWEQRLDGTSMPHHCMELANLLLRPQRHHDRACSAGITGSRHQQMAAS